VSDYEELVGVTHRWWWDWPWTGVFTWRMSDCEEIVGQLPSLSLILQFSTTIIAAKLVDRSFLAPSPVLTLPFLNQTSFSQYCWTGIQSDHCRHLHRSLQGMIVMLSKKHLAIKQTVLSNGTYLLLKMKWGVWNGWTRRKIQER